MNNVANECRHGLPIVESGPSCYYCALDKKFDPLKSQVALDEAIESVERNASPEWKKAAITAVRRVALSCPLFTTDDVWRSLMADGAEEPHEKKAIGAIMKKAAGLGYCVPTRETQKSERVVCHTRPLRIWKSLLATSEHKGLF